MSWERPEEDELNESRRSTNKLNLCNATTVAYEKNRPLISIIVLVALASINCGCHQPAELVCDDSSATNRILDYRHYS